MENNLAHLWKDISANILVLGFSGLFGVLVKAALAPAQRWRQRLAQGIAGAAAAIFLGPLLANLLSGFVDKEVYAWLAAGFLCGYGGEAIVSLVQNRLLAPKK